MKLKKIASLALAGVMAVSMLTACGEANNNNDTQKPTEPDTTPATGYSATFEGRLSASSAAKISMSDNADLNAALKSAMEFASNANIADKYDEDQHGKATFVNPKAGTPLAQVATELIKKADDNRESLDKISKTNTESGVMNLLKPNSTNGIKYNKDDADIVMLFVVNGGLSTNAAVMEVADKLDDDIDDMVRMYNSNGIDETGETMYNYTGSVSADTITLDADHGKSLTFVAVEIVRELA